MSTEISAAHEHIELSHNLDIRFDLFHADKTGLVLEGGGMRGVFTCGVESY